MNTAQQFRRPAFTLLELMVVLAIFAVLLGLILGAVQAARQQALKANVYNTFRQIQLATNQFTDTYGGAIPDVSGGPPASGLAPLVAIGPFLEAKFEHGSPISSIYRLRSDPSLAANSAPVLYPNLNPPPNNQPIIVTNSEQLGATSVAANALVFQPGVKIPTSVTDGLSCTISFTEHYSVCGTAPTTYLWTVTQVLPMTNLAGGPGSVPPTISTPSMHRATFADSVYDDILPTQAITNGTMQALTFQSRPTLEACNYRIPQSTLPGGLTVAFFDGSVRTLNDNISPKILWALVTHNAGDIANID